jgi:hypothetical protein
MTLQRRLAVRGEVSIVDHAPKGTASQVTPALLNAASSLRYLLMACSNVALTWDESDTQFPFPLNKTTA